MNPLDEAWPCSIAIAGAWGYIGRRFLDAALGLGITAHVLDPGAPPPDVSLDRVHRAASEREFYGLPADLFHLALHPAARQVALQTLLARSRTEPIAILNEKPMAPPERPELCQRLIDALDGASASSAPGSTGGQFPRSIGEQSGIPHSPFRIPHFALLLFDFHELYSPLTARIVDWLSQHRDLQIGSIGMLRCKDREDPANPRNYKLMVPIQYQETVHCLAWVLFVLGRLRGSVAGVCDGGLTVAADALPYVPPNPKDYPHIVDGQCTWRIDFGPSTASKEQLSVAGRTDFKRGAPWTKRRVVRGVGDGEPFTIEAEFQEGRKQLVINGVDQRIDPAANSSVEVIQTFGRWRRDVPYEELMHGLYPNPRFAHATYQLSSALWRSSHDRRPLVFDSFAALQRFDAGFAAAVPGLARYE